MFKITKFRCETLPYLSSHILNRGGGVNQPLNSFQTRPGLFGLLYRRTRSEDEPECWVGKDLE